MAIRRCEIEMQRRLHAHLRELRCTQITFTVDAATLLLLHQLFCGSVSLSNCFTLTIRANFGDFLPSENTLNEREIVIANIR